MTETMMAEKKDGNLFPKETEENRTEILFLSEIEEKIKKRLAEVNDSVLQGETEIENMHDYFWENYTEMDEYGYEYYDNQQALLQQANANQNLLALKRRLEKMSASPFFGKVDFRYEDEEDTESFYIGIANFAEKTGQMPLIYDWRAPVSSLFYDYDRGHAAYMAPARHDSRGNSVQMAV